jgi:hypothetical protein
VGDRIAFEVISFWDTAEAIKEYAGEEIGRAMVKPEARALLAQFDEFVDHDTLAHDTVGGLTGAYGACWLGTDFSRCSASVPNGCSGRRRCARGRTGRAARANSRRYPFKNPPAGYTSPSCRLRVCASILKKRSTCTAETRPSLA